MIELVGYELVLVFHLFYFELELSEDFFVLFEEGLDVVIVVVHDVKLVLVFF